MKKPVSEDPPVPAPEAFSPQEIVTLKEMAAQYHHRSEVQQSRTHTAVAHPTSIRPDAGLWEALREWADTNKVSYTEAMNRAIEALLAEQAGQTKG